MSLYAMCSSLGFLTEYDIRLPDYKTMDNADKYLQVYAVHNNYAMYIFILLQSWLGWEYKPFVPKTVSITVLVLCHCD